MNGVVTNICAFVARKLEDTSLRSHININNANMQINKLVNDISSKIDTNGKESIERFLHDSVLLDKCIIPNVTDILSDGRLDINDIPEFIDIIVGVFVAVKDYVAEKRDVKLTSDTVIELVGLLIKIILTLVIQDDGQVHIGMIVVDNSVKLVKVTVTVVKKPKIKAALEKICCCCCRCKCCTK